MKALVTGAGGFVGTEVVKNLLSHGYSVKALVRKKSQVEALEKIGAEVVIGDIKNKSSLEAAVSQVSKVFHIAALFRQAGLPDSEYYKVNLDGTKNVLDASISAGVEKFIHCSTIGVHGDIENPPGTELTPFAPGDIYQKSKLEAELLVKDYFENGKISGSIIRPAMIYGPGDTRTLKLFKPIAEKKFFYVGPGDALVHFIDVRDLAEAFRLAAESPNANGETFIISGKSSLRLNEVVAIISAIFGVEEPWLHLPVKPMQILGSICEAICTPLKINPPIFKRRVDFFIKNRNFDSSKAHNLLGFNPSKSLVQELIEIIDSYLESGMISRKKETTSILRTFDGKIKYISPEAEKYYGWQSQHILGEVTHQIFDTIFPEKLEKINHKISNFGKWRGLLVHKTRNDQSITVDSKWLIVPNCESNNKMILEVNQTLV